MRSTITGLARRVLMSSYGCQLVTYSYLASWLPVWFVLVSYICHCHRCHCLKMVCMNCDQQTPHFRSFWLIVMFLWLFVQQHQGGCQYSGGSTGLPSQTQHPLATKHWIWTIWAVSPHICNVNSLWRGASNTDRHRQTDRQAGRQGGRQGGRQAGRQAGRHTSKEIPTCTYLISINYVGVFRCYMHYLRIIKALSFQLTVWGRAWGEAVLLESFTQTFALLRIWQSQPCDLPLGLSCWHHWRPEFLRGTHRT